MGTLSGRVSRDVGCWERYGYTGISSFPLKSIDLQTTVGTHNLHKDVITVLCQQSDSIRGVVLELEWVGNSDHRCQVGVGMS